MDISKTFTFEAAHRLPNVVFGHKCGRLHGHSYRVDIALSGPCGPSGMVMDFYDISTAFAGLHDQLDHRYLNDVVGLENPTSEVLAQWIWNQLQLPLLSSVTVHETCSTKCVYRGPGR